MSIPDVAYRSSTIACTLCTCAVDASLARKRWLASRGHQWTSPFPRMHLAVFLVRIYAPSHLHTCIHITVLLYQFRGQQTYLVRQISWNRWSN
jgi:hypothetical protein